FADKRFEASRLLARRLLASRLLARRFEARRLWVTAAWTGPAKRRPMAAKYRIDERRIKFPRCVVLEFRPIVQAESRSRPSALGKESQTRKWRNFAMHCAAVASAQIKIGTHPRRPGA